VTRRTALLAAVAFFAPVAFLAAGLAGCTTTGGPGAFPATGACADLAVREPVSPPPVNLARPAMGWNPYNTFGTSQDQALIIGVVRALARDGMRAAGYQYVMLDDGWQGSRTSSGELTADPGRFPCGIAALAAFVHAEGFRFGIYTSPAPLACSLRPGSAGHVAQDARAFAAWGVDYVKLDWCGADYSPSAAAAITHQWRAALDATGRPMMLAINAGGSPSVGPWARLTASSWRVGGDICGSWYNQTRPPPVTARRCYNDYEQGIYDYLTSASVAAQVGLTGPGHHIDPDMLEVGTAAQAPSGADLTTSALTTAEAGTNFAMWAMWSAPLIAGNDPRGAVSAILLNPRIIAVDQDPLSRPATLVAGSGVAGSGAGAGWQAWRKPLSGGRVAIAIVNLHDAPAAATFPWAALGVRGTPSRVTDLWTGDATPASPSGLTVTESPHATAIYELASTSPSAAG
jgi:alpha-galactosidase